MNIKESNITIMVKSMDRSILFYQSLGFTLQNRWGDHYAQMSGAGIVLGIHPANDKSFNGSGNVSIGLSIDDFEEAQNLLKDLEIKATVSKDGGGTLLHFVDPDGTQLYFVKSEW